MSDHGRGALTFSNPASPFCLSILWECFVMTQPTTREGCIVSSMHSEQLCMWSSPYLQGVCNVHQRLDGVWLHADAAHVQAGDHLVKELLWNVQAGFHGLHHHSQ